MYIHISTLYNTLQYSAMHKSYVIVCIMFDFYRQSSTDRKVKNYRVVCLFFQKSKLLKMTALPVSESVQCNDKHFYTYPTDGWTYKH